MPIDQQLQDLQQAIEIAKRKLQLAETQFSSLESLSKQLAAAQKDAAVTFSRTQVDIAADISATRSSIEGSAFLPNAAGINAAAVPAAVPEASIYGLDGGSRGGDVRAAYARPRPPTSAPWTAHPYRTVRAASQMPPAPRMLPPLP